MLLSLRYKFLFVHIAKTGGTSIRNALWRQKWTDPYRIPQFLCSRLSEMTGHKIGAKFPRHAKIIAAKEMLPREVFEGLFKFAFVRNPWDLQVSSYHHIRRERPQLITHVDSFEAFLRWKFDPARPPQYHADMSTELQSDYVIDLHGNTIVDFLGRYEFLVEDFEKACRRIGIQTPKLPHSRKATDRRKDYRSYYDDVTAQLVADHYRLDIERFGYRFDEPLASNLTG
ncbi:sulfotransferase family 2 domain-containing protein [Methylocaldum sp.]|uniref:sulfotransferase family 2 domain-containing protein n=1 Tax=Methylocaldum sp. TaxID=1969727 RepID=UPI002D5BA360|nr:sulfotransferase family 2 domain-containing protein [Methylocaldum sp.]HYE34979.1 sulfotransferase family 2 domain-containing protein [Methylocaldum sp.]